MGSNKLSANRKKLIIGLSVAGGIVLAAGVTIPVVVTQLPKRSAQTAEQPGPTEDLSSDESKNIRAEYGSLLSELQAPSKDGYDKPIIQNTKTTYLPVSPVGTKNLVATFVYPNKSVNEPAVTVIYGVTIVKPRDIVEDLSENTSVSYQITYGSPLSAFAPPPARKGYGAPDVDAGSTTYRVDQEGFSSKVAFKYVADDPNAANLVVIYGVRLTKRANVERDGAPITVTYGTATNNLPLPPAETGYKAPVVKEDRTSYSPTSAVGSTNLKAVFYYEPENSLNSDLFVTSTVTVVKAGTIETEVAATVGYGTKPELVGKPSPQAGYAPPALQSSTTYRENSPVGATGLTVVWLLANNNPSEADQIVKVTVTIVKQQDTTENTSVVVYFGTEPEDVGKPPERTGFASPVIDADQTTYTSSSAIGTNGLKVVWKLTNNTPGAGDVYVHVAVTITRPVDTYEDMTASTTYGTDPSSVSKPATRTGYAAPVIDQDQTTYSSTTQVGSTGLVVWKLENLSPEAPDVYVRITVTVNKPADVIENDTATVAYGSSPQTVKKPATRRGYSDPIVYTPLTTYKMDSAVGKTGLKVVWKLTNTNHSLADVFVRVSVTVVKQSDRTETWSGNVQYGTAVEDISKPAARSGYDGPVLVPAQTTYSSTKAVGPGGYVTWKFTSQNPGMADVYYRYIVTVVKNQDAEEDQSATVPYGTPADQVGVPAARSGYAAPVLDTNRTTYTTTTTVGTGTYVVWKLVNNNAAAGDVYINFAVTVVAQNDKIETDTASAKYGTAPSAVGKPASRTGYGQPTVDNDLTTYDETTAVGDTGKIVAWRLANNTDGAADVVVKVTVTVQKQDDVIETATANAKYGTAADTIGKPAVRPNYAAPVLDTALTTYTATTAVGTTGKVVVWRLVSDNASTADVVVKVTVAVQKQSDMTETTTANAKYGTAPGLIGKPANRPNYAAPVLDSAMTTYTTSTAVSTTGTFVVWKFVNNNSSAADIYVKVAVTVQKQDDVTENATANAKYGTAPGTIGKPAVRPNYAAPVLDTAQTTYTTSTAVGTTGAFVVWKFVNNNSSAADVYVKVTVTVQKQDDAAESSAVTAPYGTAPSNVGKPQDRSGYASAVLQTSQTTYTATTTVGTTGKVVVWRFVNNNASAADVVVTVAVTVAAQSDKTEDTNATVKYGTDPSNVGKPGARNGYAAATLDTASTTYTATTPAGTTGKYVYWRMVNNTSGAGDVVVKVAVTVQKQDDVAEVTTASVAYGTAPSNVSKPQNRPGFAEPVLQANQTTYTATTTVSTTGKVVVWKLVNNNASLADVVVTVTVTVQKQSDKTETTTANAKYGTAPNTIGKPADRLNFANPVLDTTQTTYTTSTAVGTTGTFVVWKLVSSDSNAADVYVKVAVTVQKQDETIENTTANAKYGTAPGTIGKPANRPNYAAPVLDTALTTYTTSTAVGTTGTLVVWKFVNNNSSAADIYVKVAVTVQKQDDVAEVTTASVTYGTAPSNVSKPQNRPGFAEPVLQANQTTYTATTTVGTTGKVVVWRLVNNNASLADVVVTVTVTVQKQSDMTETTTASAKYGTAPGMIGKPVNRTNYAAPVLDSAMTTYTTSTAVGATGTFVVWKFVNNNSSAADVYVKVAVTVQKQDDTTENTTANAKYGAAPSTIGKPANRPNYADPVLDTALTTYTTSTHVGTTGTLVVWKFVNNNSSAGDVYVKVAVTVQKQDDVAESSAVTVPYGTAPSNVGKPQNRSNYASPALQTNQTTYTATTAVGTTGKVVVWRFANNNASAADVVVTVAVTVAAQSDKTEDAVATVKYGTDPSNVGKPGARNGYAAAVLDTASTTYTATTPAGTTGKYVYWRMVNSTSGAGDVVVKVAVTIQKKDDFAESSSSTVAYGTAPSNVSKPQDRNGYASAVLQTNQTTYTATTVVGATGKVVVWRLVNSNASEADVVVTVTVTVQKQSDKTETTTANAKYGTAPSTISKPADRPSYASPVLDTALTTYTTSTAVGTTGTLVVWKLVNSDTNSADIYVKVTVTVQKLDDVIETATANAKYGDEPGTVGKPADRPNYAAPVLDSTKTTYTANTTVGTTGTLVVWKFANNNSSAADVYVKVTVTVQKQSDKTETTTANAKYGDAPATIGKPADRPGYASPVLDSALTTYTASTAVGTTGTLVVWKLINSDTNSADIYVRVTVTVQKLDDVIETATANAKYGDEPGTVGKPADRTNYAAPVLDSAKTTYTNSTTVGTTGTLVVWKLANTNNSAADIYVKVTVTVQKQGDKTETTTANAKYGDAPATVGKPADRPNYASPVLDSVQTTYTTSTAVGTTGKLVVWKFANSNSSAADIYVKVTVTVQKQDDVAESSSTTVTYGTAPSNVGKPQDRSGYASAVLQTSQTTYTATTAVGTTGKVVVWKLVNSNVSAADVIVTVAVTISAQSDKTEDATATAKYGTAPANVGKPAARNGYAAATLDSSKTTYTATTTVGTTGTYVYWRLANNTTGAGDIVVKVAVTVQKQDDAAEQITSTVDYGTEPANVSKPADRTGYASAVLQTNQTTYTSTTTVGTTGKVVVWRLANTNTSAADVVVTVTVTVRKQSDKTETATANAKYGAAPNTVGKPVDRTGFATPVLDSTQTTYTSSTAVGTTGTLVVWKFVSSNTSAADVYLKVTVTVQKQDDTAETAANAIDVTEGTPLTGLPTPPVKTGYGTPTVVSSSTTYSATSAVGANANVVYKYVNNDANKGDLVFTQPVRVIARPQAFVLQRTEILNSVLGNGAPAYDLSQVTLDAKNEFSGTPTYWYKGVQQTGWNFAASVHDGETITVSYPIAAKQGTNGAQGKLEVNYVVAIKTAPIFVYPAQKRFANAPLPAAPAVPSGYQLAETTWYLDNNQTVATVSPDNAKAAGSNTRLQVVYRYSKANAMDVYVTKVLYTSSDKSKAVTGKYQIPYGVQPVFTPLIEGTGTSWSQIRANVTKAVATSADNYDAAFASSSTPTLEKLGTAPAGTTYNALLSTDTDSFAATIDVLVVKLAFTPPSETTTMTYKTNELPANYRPTLPSPMTYGSIIARVSDTTARTPGFFYRFHTLANLGQLAAAPPGTTIGVNYTINRLNSNYSYSGPLNFHLTFASVDNPTLDANPLHVIYGNQLSTAGLLSSPDPTKYGSSKGFDVNLTTYDTTFKPNQPDLFAVLVYPSLTPGADPLYVVRAVQVDMRTTVKTDQAIDDYTLYTKGSPAPVIDEHSFTLPEGIVINGLPVYRDLSNNQVITAAQIPGLPAGSRFVAQYDAQPAKYYDGNDIKVRITYYVNHPNPTNYVVAPIIYYGSQQPVNIPAAASGVARTVLYGKDGTFKETTNVYAGDATVSEYWIRVDDYDAQAMSTQIQLIYVSKTNATVTTKPQAPTLTIAKGATVHTASGSTVASFKIKTSGPAGTGFNAGSNEATYQINRAPSGTVYEFVYATGGTNDTVSLKVLPSVYYGNPNSTPVNKGDLVEGRLPDQTSQSLGKPPVTFGAYLYQTYKITQQAPGNVGYYTDGTTFDLPALITNAPVGTIFERTYRSYALSPDPSNHDSYRTGAYDTYTETYRIIALKSV